MKLGEKIVAAEEHLEELRGQVADIVKDAEADGRDLLDEETDQIEALEGEIEGAEKALRGLKSAEKALAHKAETKGTTARGNGLIPARAAEKEKGGALIAKMATVAVLAHLQKKSPEDVLRERYSHDPRVEAVIKAATTGATTTAAGWAAELVETGLASFMNELEAVSVYGAMAAGGTAIPFGGMNAISIPRRSGSGNVSGSFVGENASIPVKQDHYAAQVINRYKVGVITVISKELQRVSTPQIEGLLRSAIIQDTGDMIDGVVLNPSASAVAGIRPASPFNGAATQASAGDTLADILTDLRFLMSTLSAANAGRNSRFIMHPDRLVGLSMLTNANGAFVFAAELAQGRLMGIPVIVSTNCPAAQVYITDLADFATAFGVPEFDVSEQATLAMADDDGVAPTMTNSNAISDAGSIHISDAAGTTPATVVRSMFQTWQLGLRMVMPLSWAHVRPGTTAYLTAVSW